MDTFNGYHGTDASNYNSICKNNFQLSTNFDDWMGTGVYFFIRGISDPIRNAEKWGRSQAWDKDNKKYKYNLFAVISANILVDEVLDLTNNDGLTEFNTFRDTITARYIAYKDAFTRGHSCETPDCYIYNAIAETMELDAIIKNLYIKDRDQRVRKMHSATENTTVLCVKSSNSIDKKSIKNHNTGEVNDNDY